MKIAIKSYGEELKWIDSNDIEVDGKKLSVLLAEQEKKYDDAVAEIAAVKLNIETRITNFINAYKGV